MLFMHMKNIQERNLRVNCLGRMKMNKLMGFYELKEMSLPSIRWEEYTGEQQLRNNILWTVRSAVYSGDDLNLPRKVGVSAKEATQFADNLRTTLNGNGIVICYPYFIAKKSGTLEIRNDKTIVEAVEDDLWNLVTLSKKNVTYQITERDEKIDGDRDFLSKREKEYLLSFVREIKKTFRNDMLEGKGVLLEWSFAKNCNIHREPEGEEYLVFYEARTI